MYTPWESNGASVSGKALQGLGYLAQGGEGLGTLWGREKAIEYMKAAGFRAVEVQRLEHDMRQGIWPRGGP